MVTANERVSAQAEDGVPDTSGGPVIDIVGHLRELRSAVLPALVVAVVLGSLVGLVRSFTPETFERSATARISISSATTSETFARAAAAQFESLGQDTAVLDAVAGTVGLRSPDDVAEAVTVRANIAPGVMDVSARAGSPELAEQLVTTMITELDRVSVERSGPDSEAAIGIAADLSAIESRIRSMATRDPEAAAELYAQRDALSSQQQATAGQAPLTLTMLSLKHWDGERVAPRPVTEGAVVALIAFLLALEGIVLFNSRGGRAVTPTWARRTGTALGIDVDSAPVDDGRLPVPTEIHLKKLGDEGAVIAVFDAALDEDPEPEGDGPDPRADAAGKADVAGKADSAGKTVAVEKADVAGKADSAGKADAAKKADTAADDAEDADSAGGTDAATVTDADAPADGADASDARPVPAAVPGVTSFALSDRWWDRIDLTSISLAVLVVDEGRTSKADVLGCIDTLAVADVPTRLVVRESPDFSGPLAWLKT